MFDSIYIQVSCPKCKRIGPMECQTKELDCQLESFYMGSLLPTDEPTVNAIVVCPCKYHFDIDIELTDGIVTGKYQISEHQPFYYNQ